MNDTVKKGDAKKPFGWAVKHDRPVAPDNRVPDMIKTDHPEPRPSPPGNAHLIDAQAFNQRWREEMKAIKALDPFEAAQQPQLKDGFNQASDEVGEAYARMVNTEDQLAKAIDDYLLTHDREQDIPQTLMRHIDALNWSVQVDERWYGATQDNGQSIDPPLKLSDAFDQIQIQIQIQDKGLGR